MRNIKTKSLRTAMYNIAMRIRMDMVLHVAFIKEPTGGYHWLWLTEAGNSRVQWELKFNEGRVNVVNLPEKFTTED